MIPLALEEKDAGGEESKERELGSGMGSPFSPKILGLLLDLLFPPKLVSMSSLGGPQAAVIHILTLLMTVPSLQGWDLAGPARLLGLG